MLGRAIGNYTVTAELGAGGMGKVYRARDTKLNRDVAIKVVPEAFSGDPERLARFEREARLLATLNHTNIGGVYGLEDVGGQRFLIMELVEGEDLSTRIARGPVAIDDAIEIALQIATALEAAHEQGVIHRDLKPANIRVTDDGRVKVLDFGLAKALDPTESSSSPAALTQSPTAFMSSPTMAGVILGTAAYMSPEQARGKRVDKRADIFAFGIVFYEMLTGKLLFAGDTVSDTLAAVLRETPDLEALPAQTPRAIKRLIARCLDKDPRRRLRDIGEARIVLEDVRSGVARDEAATPASVAPARRSFFQAYGGWIAAAAVGVVAVALMMRPKAAVDTPREVRRASITMSNLDDSFRFHFMPSISPDGRYVVFASNDELWLRDLTQLHARAIPGTKGGKSPFWSADGTQIGFGRESALMRVSRDGGEPTLITTLPLGMTLEGTGCVTWDAQDRLVVGPSNAGLQSVSARGGKVTEWITPTKDESDFHELCILPDDYGYVAVLHNKEGIGNLELVRPDGSRKHLMHVQENILSPAYSPTGHLVFERRGESRGVWAIAYNLEREETTGEPFLVVAGGRAPSVARDGTLCYVDNVIEMQSQPVWIDRTGAVVGRLEPADITYRPFPAISPDGRTVAMANQFTTARELFLYDLGNGSRRRLSFTDYGEEIPKWHPNGVDVLCYSWTPPAMWLYPTTSGAQPKKLGRGIMPVVSPDGSTLVYCLQRDGEWNFDILARPIDGDSTTIRELITTPTVDWWPSFSPDGNFLVFVSGSSGRDEVYATTFPEPSTLWQISSNGGNFPQWSANGRAIYFTTSTEIWSASVSAGDRSLAVGTPQVVCKRPTTNWSGRWPDGFDVTADEKRFLVLEAVNVPNDTPPAIVTIQNWFEEFRTASAR